MGGRSSNERPWREVELFPIAARSLALILLFTLTFFLTFFVVRPWPHDFAVLWSAAQLALEGRAAAAYDLAQLNDIVRQGAGRTFDLPFVYPPPLLLIVAAVAWLPLGIAVIPWLVLTYSFFLATTRLFLQHSGWQISSFMPVFANAIIGQTGFLFGGALLAGVHFVTSRPLVAGAFLGLLVMKPQIALLVPVALIAAGLWRALAAAAAAAAMILVAGLLVFGGAAYAAFFEAGTAFANDAAWHRMTSVYGTAVYYGASNLLAFGCHAVVAGWAAFAVWKVWAGPASSERKSMTLLAASALASPYLFAYDLVFLAIPLLWLAQQGGKSRWLLLLWIIPIHSYIEWLGRGVGYNFWPILPIAILVAILRNRDPKPVEGQYAMA